MSPKVPHLPSTDVRSTSALGGNSDIEPTSPIGRVRPTSDIGRPDRVSPPARYHFVIFGMEETMKSWLLFPMLATLFAAGSALGGEISVLTGGAVEPGLVAAAETFRNETGPEG